VQPAVHDHGLLRRTTWVNIPRTRFLRFLKGLVLLPILLAKRPAVVFRIAVLHARDRTTPAIDALYFALRLSRMRSRHDVVHCQFGPLGAIGAVLRDVGVLDGKLVTSFRGYDLSLYLRRFGRGVYSRLLVRGDLFLASSDHFRKRLITELGGDEGKIVVHRSGIDLERFATLPPRPDRASSPARILTVGRLVEKKGVEYAIRALARVARDHPDVVYTIIGDGVLRNDLQALVEALRLEERVFLLGERTHDEIVEHLARSSFLVAPSVTAADGDQEGIPNTLKEAMAAGLPVVTTRHAGIPELVEDGVSGYLVPERDVDLLAARIRDLVAHPERRDAMGRAGRLFVRQNYDADVLNAQLVALYNRLL
jgi:colanic acid/amylovoran biosynthesis glycosyltransferase